MIMTANWENLVQDLSNFITLIQGSYHYVLQLAGKLKNLEKDFYCQCENEGSMYDSEEEVCVEIKCRERIMHNQDGTE